MAFRSEFFLAISRGGQWLERINLSKRRFPVRSFRVRNADANEKHSKDKLDKQMPPFAGCIQNAGSTVSRLPRQRRLGGRRSIATGREGAPQGTLSDSLFSEIIIMLTLSGSNPPAARLN